jgi:hypothetical protein
MKLIYIKLLLILVINSYSQVNNKSLKELFIDKLCEDKQDYSLISKLDTLYVFGKGTNYIHRGTFISFMEINEVRKKVKKNGEFNMVFLNEIIIVKDKITSSFEFLKALKKGKTDFVYFDDSNAIYCLEYNCEKKNNEVVWCGTKNR